MFKEAVRVAAHTLATYASSSTGYEKYIIHIVTMSRNDYYDVAKEGQ